MTPVADVADAAIVGSVTKEPDVVDVEVPIEFVAFTATVYSVPAARPVIDCGEVKLDAGLISMTTGLPPFTGVAVIVYLVRATPPVLVGGVMVNKALLLVPAGTAAETAPGEVGIVGATPRFTTAVPVAVAPPEMVDVTVIVKFVALITAVGVPEITPVLGSSVKPAGKGPAIVYTVPVAPVAVRVVVIGVIAVPIDADSVEIEGVTSIGVTKVLTDATVGPVPDEFVAETVTPYSVPGVRPVTETGEEIALARGETELAVPEPVGATMTE